MNIGVKNLKKKIHSDIFVGIFLEALCAFFFFYGRKLPNEAKAFPDIVLFLIALLSAFVIIEGIRKTKQMNSGTAVKDISWEKIRYPLLTLAISVAYYLIFRYVGYFVATPILLVVLMLIFGVRSWKLLVLIPAGYMVFTYILFVWQLGVRLI